MKPAILASGASGPPGLAVCAVGDIHGEDALLARMHDCLDALIAPSVDRLEVYLGDVIDRGPDSRAVIDRLILRRGSRDCVFIRGNHERMMLGALDGGANPRPWLRMGGLACLASYGALSGPAMTSESPALRERLRDCMPLPHVAFLRGMAADAVLGDLVLTHEPARGPEGTVNIHGHVQAPAIRLGGSSVSVDTGAYRTGVLSALIVHGGRAVALSVTRAGFTMAGGEDAP